MVQNSITEPSWNKEFLETDYPQGRTIGVFRRFHFGLRAKNRNSVFYLTQNRKSGFDLSKGEVKSETPGQSPEELFSIKNPQVRIRNKIAFVDR